MPDEFGIFRQVCPIVGEVGEGAFIFVGRGEMGRGFEEDTRGADVDGLFFDARPDAQIFGCFFEVSEVCRGLAVEEFESESFVDIGGSVSEGLPGDPHGAHGGEGFLGGLGPGFEDAGFWGGEEADSVFDGAARFVEIFSIVRQVGTTAVDFCHIQVILQGLSVKAPWGWGVVC